MGILYWHGILKTVTHVLLNVTVTRWFCPPEAYPDACFCEAEIRGPNTDHILTLSSHYQGDATLNLSWGDHTQVDLEDYEDSVILSNVLDILAYLGYYDVTVNEFLYLLASLAGASGTHQMWSRGLASGGERKALPPQESSVVVESQTESN